MCVKTGEKEDLKDNIEKYIQESRTLTLNCIKLRFGKHINICEYILKNIEPRLSYKCKYERYCNANPFSSNSICPTFMAILTDDYIEIIDFCTLKYTYNNGIINNSVFNELKESGHLERKKIDWDEYRELNCNYEECDGKILAELYCMD